MKVFGLTGGMGMGKSTAAELLRPRVAIVDTDALARQVVEPGKPALAEVRALFGPEILAEDGRLRREELARRVFADESARQKLEAILHPRIRACWQAQIETWRAEGKKVGVVVIPLLFETNAAACFDATVCVACSAATQRERLRARGLTPEQIEQRLQAQWPVEKKLALADFVIWTEGGLAVHEEQWARIIPAA